LSIKPKINNMKKIIFGFICTMLISFAASAQSDKSGAENSGPASKAVYGEFGGSGLLFSANFDSRFKGYKGLGFRVGVGMLAAGDGAVISFPFGINGLAGKGPHHFEYGATATLLTATYGGFDEGESAWFFMPHFGYRYTKPSNSFNGRIYIGPIIADGFTFFPFAGLSVGYTLPHKK
jgi:hypothetical protein